MSKKTQKAWLKALSGLFINISAAWFGLAFISPNFVELSNIEVILVLFKDIFFGILFLLTSVVIERSNYE